jgi:hypothetical protein
VKKLITLSALVLATVMTGSAAQQAAEKPKQDPKAEAAARRRRRQVDSHCRNAERHADAMELKVDGKKVTGTLSSPQGEVGFAGGSRINSHSASMCRAMAAT